MYPMPRLVIPGGKLRLSSRFNYELGRCRCGRRDSRVSTAGVVFEQLGYPLHVRYSSSSGIHCRCVRRDSRVSTAGVVLEQLGIHCRCGIRAARVSTVAMVPGRLEYALPSSSQIRLHLNNGLKGLTDHGYGTLLEKAYP